MNLHVCNDEYGLYPTEIAKRIQSSAYAANNLMVNLSETSKYRHDKITYIPVSSSSFKRYISRLTSLEKIIFHPYNLNSFHFLTYVLKKFPHVKVYWVCWSYELYKHPQFLKNLYEPFSTAFIKNETTLRKSFRNISKKIVLEALDFSGLRKNFLKGFLDSYNRIDYFCSFLRSDYDFFIALSPKKDVEYVPFSYLSLNNIMPDLDSFSASGNEIMIGHSALPDGNHYEIIQRLAAIDPNFQIFLPLVYGNKKYAAVIKREASRVFKNISIQEEKLDSVIYYKRLTKVSWAIINSKVQQGLGNILALIWMGTKVFLDEKTSTYKDLKKWGIHVYTVQHDLTKEQLTQKLAQKETEDNRSIILEKVNEHQVNKYWEPILT
jgi:dTDP-N-acetylfucosamine:lipid II N-acetylfucosaminyltransferase